MTKHNNLQSISVRIAVKTPAVSRALEEIVSTLDGFEQQLDEKATQTDVLVLEVGDNPAKEFETVRALLEDGVVNQVFLTSAKTTTDILLPALRTGAKQFFQQPLVFQEVQQAFVDIHKERIAGEGIAVEKVSIKPGKMVSVLGAKGGVGTTTVAVNLAVSLNRLYPEKTIALVDMNRVLGEVTVFLDLQTEFNWDELVKNISRLDPAYLAKALIQSAPGLYVMPAPNSIESGSQVSSQVMKQVLETTKNSFDFVIVDAGTQVGASAFRIFSSSDTIALITTLSLPCIINVKRLLGTMRLLGSIPMNNINIIANRFEKKSAISLEDTEKMTGHSVYSTLPNDYQKTLEAINTGKPLVDVAKNSQLVKSLNKLAESLIVKEEPVVKRKSWFW
ncbi:AAA family ATPase [Desulfosediminicola sp.]|uniref:AAA family ATPase n=1 Tax=Desulfosediminicola sp. TaxID=2886825 RepID=UPI003AF22E56